MCILAKYRAKVGQNLRRLAIIREIFFISGAVSRPSPQSTVRNLDLLLQISLIIILHLIALTFYHCHRQFFSHSKIHGTKTSSSRDHRHVIQSSFAARTGCWAPLSHVPYFTIFPLFSSKYQNIFPTPQQRPKIYFCPFIASKCFTSMIGPNLIKGCSTSPKAVAPHSASRHPAYNTPIIAQKNQQGFNSFIDGSARSLQL